MKYQLDMQSIQERLCDVLDNSNSLDELEDNKMVIYFLCNALEQSYVSTISNDSRLRKLWFVKKVVEMTN